MYGSRMTIINLVYIMCTLKNVSYIQIFVLKEQNVCAIKSTHTNFHHTFSLTCHKVLYSITKYIITFIGST